MRSTILNEDGISRGEFGINKVSGSFDFCKYLQ